MATRYLLGIVLCAAAFTNCKRTVPCNDHFITPAFIGFALSDLDSVIIRQFKKEGNFQQLIDTAILSFDTSYLKSISSNDTTFVLLNHISGQEKYIFPDHDWQLFITSKNLTYSISAILSPKTESPCFKCSCWNPISSFTQNSQTIIPKINTIPHTGGDFYITYIHR